MKRIILALLLAFSAASAGAEAPPLQLRIVDAEAEPISGARVQAGNAAQDGMLHQGWYGEAEVVRAGETSTDGVVRLSGLPLERAIWILIEKKGFMPELRSLMLSKKVSCTEVGITLRPGEATVDWGMVAWLPVEGFNLPMFVQERVVPDHYSITGVLMEPEIRQETGALVTGRDDVPIPGAVLFASWDDGFLETITGADGVFRLEGIPSGPLEVIARAPRFYQETKKLDVSGGQVAIDFSLAREEEGITLRGEVLTVDGEPVEGAVVWINNLLVHSTRDGSFTLVLPSQWKARWEIKAEKQGFARGQTPLEVQGKCMTGIEVRLTEDTK